ncbi:MAG: hypothetical protein IKR71_10195 [Bacteroidales bacterium]|nr:hypothetical protein [Bacteroidales bacterium]
MSQQKKHTCEVYHFDLYGTREEKYNYLQTHNLNDVEWQQLTPQAPSYFFVPKDFSLQKEYEKGFGVNELMKFGAFGIVTFRDELLVQYSQEELSIIKNDFESLNENEFRGKYKIQDSRDWTYKNARNNVNESFISKVNYRPFDVRYVLYSPKSKGILSYPRYEIMRHLLNENVAFCTIRVNRSDESTYFVSNQITDKTILSSKDNTSVFPLYLYPESDSIDTSRRPNLNKHIWAQINTAIGKEASPEDIFDYIYGVLHSPAYRAKYKEFLKVDFPQIPYPKDQAEFEHFRSFGYQLRELHLMHNVPESPVTFPESGSMVVEKIVYDSDKVRINGNQYFANVPTEAWEFYIGGYQPAQKWLKDRKGRTLSFDDIEHYRKIIAVLLRTAELMREIDHGL